MEDTKSSDGICGADEFWTSWMAPGEADRQTVHFCVCTGHGCSGYRAGQRRCGRRRGGIVRGLSAGVQETDSSLSQSSAPRVQVAPTPSLGLLVCKVEALGQTSQALARLRRIWWERPEQTLPEARSHHPLLCRPAMPAASTPTADCLLSAWWASPAWAPAWHTHETELDWGRRPQK